MSVCSNSWNVTLSPSEYGPVLLEMLVYGLKSVKYGGGSIEKLDLNGCRGVMEGGYLLQMPCQILQQIQSLTLRGCGLDQNALDIKADYIPHLPSLLSLDISNNPGGVGSTVKLLWALRQHGKLKALDMHDIVIGMDDVAALSDLIQSPAGSLTELSVGPNPVIEKDLVLMRAAVVFSSQSPGSFREVNIGFYSLSKEGQWVLHTEVFQQLMRTLFSPSSLETLDVGTGSFASPLDHIEIISDSLTVLTFNNYWFPLCFKIRSPSSSLLSNISQQPIPNFCIKGGTKLSHILRENTSLRVLKLLIPLDRDEVHDIIIIIIIIYIAHTNIGTERRVKKKGLIT